jgi:D-alanyl-D-alanine carboxypeptidase
MFCVRAEAPRGLRITLFGLSIIMGLVAVASDPADARSRRKRVRSSYHPAYAAIVVDANSGKVMHAANADALRHPASLTKIMTLYLLFERLDAGGIKLDSPLRVSEHAAGQAPTKLGLKAGSTISVEDAIKGMVTRSANDAAVVVAENLGGSERGFGKLMTLKAQALGMTRTVYNNASGLPDDDQVTTARDQSILARAIQERFPRYYKYFSIRSFQYRGHSIANHNHLLGRVEGVDGIKTGYTRASGFNLVTSLHRDHRYVVAVVLGGSSAGSRDAKMRALLDQYVDDASVKRTAPMVAERHVPQPPTRSASAQPASKQPAPPQTARRTEPTSQGFSLASAFSKPVSLDPPVTATIRPPGQVPGSTDPIKPVAVKTLQVRPGKLQTASMMPLHLPSAGAAPEGARPGVLGVLHTRTALAATESGPSVAPPSAAPKTRSGWIIQVGAYPAEDEARHRLDSVKSKASRLLADAEPFTESVQKGKTTYYRARFAGLDKDKAEAACKYLKHNDVDCIAIKN